MNDTIRSKIADTATEEIHLFGDIDGYVMDLMKDAARWRWLREQSKQVAPVAAVVWQTPVNSGNWVNTSDLDANVDRYVEHDE